jgi:D-xylose reductase
MRYARIEPQVLQVELHPYLTQVDLVKLAKAFGMAVTAYSSFGPQSYVEIGTDRKAPSLLQHEVVGSIAQVYGKGTRVRADAEPMLMVRCTAPAQVLLRWATQRQIAVIPKSNNLQRLISNLQSGEDFTISEADMQRLDALNINLRVRIRFAPPSANAYSPSAQQSQRQ